MTNVLIYNRPWHFEQFEHLAREIWPGCQPISVSEHKSADPYGLSAAFYAAIETQRAGMRPDHLSEQDVADVILRCRLLRTLDIVTARKLVFAMDHAVEICLQKHQPVSALSITVDSYVIHLICLACRRRGIPFIGLIPSFVSGYFRITALGERTFIRAVEEAEAERIRDMLLRPEYKPDYLAQTPWGARKRAVRNWMRNLPKPLWFRARLLISGDRLNYHYMASQLIAQRYWSLWPQRYRGQRPERRGDLRGMDTNKPLVFLPLQMSPEATIDYWSTDTSWIDYENRVLSLLDTYRGSCIFLVKEHPNVLGFRTRGFYRRLKSRNNCVMIAPEVSSNDVLDMCDATVICTGTVGFEAALRGVPVYSDSRQHHLPESFVKPVAELKKLRTEHIGKTDVRFTATNRPDDESIQLTRAVLEGLLIGHLNFSKPWRHENEDDARNNTVAAHSIREFLAREDSLGIRGHKLAAT